MLFLTAQQKWTHNPRSLSATHCFARARSLADEGSQKVEALILDPTKGTVQESNKFHFIFDTTNISSAPLPAIAPATKQEAGLVLFFETELAALASSAAAAQQEANSQQQPAPWP